MSTRDMWGIILGFNARAAINHATGRHWVALVADLVMCAICYALMRSKR